MNKNHVTIGRGVNGEFTFHLNGQLRAEYATAEEMQLYIAESLLNPSPMRVLIESEIISGWRNGLCEITNVAYYNCWEPQSSDRDVIMLGKWKLKPSIVDEQLRDCVANCNDEGLFAWLTAQHCQVFR